MFQVPSTPDSSRIYKDDAPSTTPAGPPPTGFTAQSFTPAGPPPSSVFGSSLGGNLTSAKPAFGPTGHLNSPSIKGPLHTNPFGAKKGFFVPDSSPPRELDEEDDYEEEDADGEEMEDEDDFLTHGRQVPQQNGYQRYDEEDESDLIDLPRGAKRSRNGDIMAGSMRSSRMLSTRNDREAVIPGITKGLAATMPPRSAIEETDDLVLNTETVLSSLDASLKNLSEDELEVAIGKAARKLNQEWSKYTDKESLPAAIGPVQKSGLARATYIASLLFHIHHPTSNSPGQQQTPNPFGRSSRLTSLVPRSRKAIPVPKSLINWLNVYHNPYPEDVTEVVQCKPSPTAHERFWDVIFATMLRGNIALTVQLLSNADFSHADTAIEDGYDEPGYEGRQLTSIQYVVAQCAELLSSCPAFTEGDWDVKNTEWALFRTRVRRALEDLESYAEEGNADRDGVPGNVFQSTRLGGSFSTASRKAESKVPWTIYEQLKTMYGQLLGYREEILLSAQDWLEAVIYLTAWWDGEDEDAIPKGSLAAGRRSLRHAQHTRQVDVAPVSAYKRRLLSAFASVTDEPEDAVLGVNTVDPVQVALACVCEDDIEGVVSIVRKWSVPITAAVVDVASAGGWLPDARPRSGGVIDGFDQSDLMVLSHGQTQEKTGLDRDEVLGQYADMLAKRDEFRSSDGQIEREGWEMAVRVLSRLNSADAAERKIGQVFDAMAFDSTQQVDKALAVCNELGLAGQVRKISERYADGLAESTHSYGEAIVYYARARSVQQLRSTLDLLISMSLVQSAAYPSASALDRQLDLLLNDQRNTLNQLARVDMEAAQLVANHLSGYATLRKFYELRDETEDDDESRKSGLRPFARKRETARAITALIGSAADTIRGGLYDSETAAVVQVDTLLALLGEALPLMEQSKPLLKQPQLMTLLRATEDLQTVSSRIYEQAETLLQAAMSDYNGSRVISPQDLSKSMSKSTSNLAGSSYGMVNSHGSIESEYRMEGVEQDESSKGWDWRKGLATVAGKNAKGEDVLRILRVQVAKEMARAWSETL